MAEKKRKTKISVQFLTYGFNDFRSDLVTVLVHPGSALTQILLLCLTLVIKLDLKLYTGVKSYFIIE